jgi:peroxiredoxin
MPGLATGTLAPPLEGIGTDGRKYSLKGALARGPVLAAFFKVSCPTCQFAFPFIERLYRQFSGKGVTVWGVAQDNASHSRDFAKKHGITFPILVDDPPYPTSREYMLKVTPTLFLICAEGKLSLVSEGFARRDFIEIQKRLASRLNVEPTALFRPDERIPEYKPG